MGYTEVPCRSLSGTLEFDPSINCSSSFAMNLLRPWIVGFFCLVHWDGRDANGTLVPPGIYLCRIGAGAVRGTEDVLFPIHVAY